MNSKCEREKILKCNGNIVISAGAGSGKTSILTNKILHDLENNNSYRKVAAITFTNKAADEIKSRLKGKYFGNYIGTNDSFIESEIIRPFIKDAFDGQYTDNFIVTYTEEKFNTYNDGLNVLKTKKILSKFKNNKLNFKFQLALDILNRSIVARQYLIARYSRIYIDEYQDSDNDMHKLFMYLKNLGIKLFIVGDIKQCIFKWRGSNPNLFKSLLTDIDFDSFILEENFRCCDDVQNYSNIMYYKNLDRYIQKEQADSVIGIENGDAFNYLDLNKEITILVSKIADIITIEEKLRSEGMDFVYIPRNPLDDLDSVNKNILIEIAKFTKNSRYSVFDIIKNLGLELNSDELYEFKNIINRLRSNLDYSLIEKILIDLFGFLQLEFNGSKEIDIFSRVILSNEFDNSFNGEEFKHKLMTIHSSKGLEFEQVVVLASDYQIYNGKYEDEHYVSLTRAKNKLVIILNDIYYKKNIETVCNSLNIKVEDIIYID